MCPSARSLAAVGKLPACPIPAPMCLSSSPELSASCRARRCPLVWSSYGKLLASLPHLNCLLRAERGGVPLLPAALLIGRYFSSSSHQRVLRPRPASRRRFCSFHRGPAGDLSAIFTRGIAPVQPRCSSASNSISDRSTKAHMRGTAAHRLSRIVAIALLCYQ